MRLRSLLVPALSVAVVACAGELLSPSPAADDVLLSAAMAGKGPPSHAVVTFGREHVGTDFFPPGSHDSSFKAIDAIRPRTTVISAGGTVDFVVSAAHKIAIYAPGTSPDDIDTSLLVPPGTPFPFPPLIDDPNNRIAQGALGFGPPTVFSWTFNQPGRYLVICQVLPHFAGAKMYAWVDVK